SLGNRTLIGAGAEASSEDRGCNRLQVGLSGEVAVQRLESMSRFQQQLWRIAPATADEHDLGTRSLQTCALKLAEGTEFSRGEEGGGRRRVRDLELRLRRRE